MTTPTIEQEPDGEQQEQNQLTESPVVPAAPDAACRAERVRQVLLAVRTVTVTLLLLGSAVSGGTYIVHERLAARAYLDLGTAVLTAEPVPVGSPAAAVVTRVAVAASGHVSAGQILAVLSLPPPVAGQAPVSVTLRAPIAGSVATVNAQMGGVVQAGEPVVTLYDQSRLTFQSDVSVDRIRRLRLGMTASITGPGIQGTLHATLARVVPRIGDGPLESGDQLTVVLVPMPADRATVRTLVPGLPYAATVNTHTATAGTPAVNSAG